MNRILLPLAAGTAMLWLAACKHTPPANVAAEVNGHAITNEELEKAYQSNYAQQSEGASEDQIMSQKLDLVINLINNEIMLQRAESLGLSATDAELDGEIAKMRSGYTKEEFDKQLADRHMTMEDLRAQKRRQLTIDKLITKEITSKIAISDADVKAFYEANKASFNLAEPAIHMAQILVTPFPDPNVRNLKNSKAQTDKDAKLKIEDIMARLKRNEDFAMLAQNYSEEPNSAPNGGDMGFVRESDLEKANPELRKLVVSLPPNGISPVFRTPEGYRILKVISKEPAGQRELNDPRVQNSIREALINSKNNLLQQAYYETARNGAKIQNYLAKKVVDGTKTK